MCLCVLVYAYMHACMHTYTHINSDLWYFYSSLSHFTTVVAYMNGACRNANISMKICHKGSRQFLLNLFLMLQMTVKQF